MKTMILDKGSRQQTHMKEMNTHTAISDIRRALCGRGFIIAAIGIAMVVFISSLDSIIGVFRSETLQPNGFYARLVLTALDADGMTMALPILCALPYTACFIDDMKSGYIKQYLHRTTVRQYLFGKTVACALSGGLVLAAGVLLSYGVSALVFTPMEAAPAAKEAVPPYFAELLSRLLLFFLSGAFWAVLGMMLSTLTGSRYMAYASPFILYYVLIILYERYFDRLYVLYPKEWLNPSGDWVLGTLGVMVFILELMLIASLGFAVAARKKIGSV